MPCQPYSSFFSHSLLGLYIAFNEVAPIYSGTRSPLALQALKGESQYRLGFGGISLSDLELNLHSIFQPQTDRSNACCWRKNQGISFCFSDVVVAEIHSCKSLWPSSKLQW